MGSPASGQLTTEVWGLRHETMTTRVVTDALQAQLGSSKQDLLLGLQRGYEYVL